MTDKYRYPTIKVGDDARAFAERALELYQEKRRNLDRNQEINKELDLLRDVLHKELGRGKCHIRMEGGYHVSLGEKGEVDRDAFKKDYPADEHPYLYTHTPSPTGMRKNLPEVEWSKYLSQSVYLGFKAPDT